ncbi:hypothetical protein JCM19236_2727 [Vibrio sp. JCM 19236]|nr:hypothetical protein JCM19236_2727 [Vibrio sp. JCM 19236]
MSTLAANLNNETPMANLVDETQAVVSNKLRMSIEDLSFYYAKGAKPSLKQVSMPIYKNRVTALIGPSGCGKSTCFVP